jgi:hypothetical protein
VQFVDSHFMRPILLVVCLLAASPSYSQRVDVRVASPNYMPAPVDSNSPAYWFGGQLRILNSANIPLLSLGFSQFYPMDTNPVAVNSTDHMPMWMEAAWLDDEGTLFGYYHHEPAGLCPGTSLTAPRIGAALSRNGGRTWRDIGVILEAAELPDCSARNGYFAGGHGDFSAVVDHGRRHIYFYFGAYGGDVSSQGIAVARLAYADRYAPIGAVWKYFDGAWTEPGIRGRVTPILPALTAWQRENTNSFWGPSLHWNHHLRSWVMLLNRACCEPGWPQEGIYISYSADVTNAAGWTPPLKIIDDVGFGPGWYPQVLGTMIGETDKFAGRIARLYIHGVSHWDLVFHRADGLPEPPPGLPAFPAEGSSDEEDAASRGEPVEPVVPDDPDTPREPDEPTEPDLPPDPPEDPEQTEDPGRRPPRRRSGGI